MTRDVDSTTLTAFEQDKLIEVVLVEINIDTPLYLHNYVGDIEYNSNTYTGLGDFGKISSIISGQDLNVEKITMSLSGINNSIISQALGTNYQYKEINIYITNLNLSTYVINTPVKVFTGLLDNMTISSGKESEILLTAVNKLFLLTKPNIRRYNLPDQITRHPFDSAFKYVDQLSNQNIVWGSGFSVVRI